MRETQLSEFLENAVVGLHWVAGDGTILWANKAEMDLLGYQREEYIGHHIAEFHVDAPVIEDMLRRLQVFNEQWQGYEARLRCKDGSIRHVRVYSNALIRGWQVHSHPLLHGQHQRTKAGGDGPAEAGGDCGVLG